MRSFLHVLVPTFAVLIGASSGARVAAQTLPVAAGGEQVGLAPSFAGISLDRQFLDLAQGAWPPSPSSAVGPEHVVEMQNQSVAIFTRTGTLLQHKRLRDFLTVTSHGIKYSATFDPQLVFDSKSQRWFAACVAAGAGPGALPDPVILGVSRSADPTGSWSNFLVPLGEAAVGNDFKSTGGLTLGVDGQGVYFGVRIFPTTSSEFCKIAATPKSSLIASHASLGKITQFPPITGVVNSPVPAVNLDAAAATGPEWVVASVTGAGSGLRWWKITWSRTTPTLSSPGDVATPAFGSLPDAAQDGTATPVETEDERLQSTVIRNGHLWTCRTVGVNAAGSAAAPDRTACEWLDFNVGGNAPALTQSGRVFDPTGLPRFYYFPTLSVNSASDAVLSFCGSKSTEFIGAYFTGRLHTDTPGSMSDVQVLKGGEATYERTVGNGSLPFGRHGTVCIDPVDDFSFWTIQPYAADTPTPDSWGTWIARIQLSEPPVPPGEVRIAPLALKFGSVKVGKTKSKSFTITSRGDHPLIGAVNDVGAPFVVTAGAGEFRLERGKKLRVTVRFAPTVKGAVPATPLHVTTNDPERPDTAIALSGTGK